MPNSTAPLLRSRQARSAVLLPPIYGVGTALPVIVVAFLLAYSAQSVGKTYNDLSKLEWWARTTTGWVFILVGAYFALAYVFQVPLRFS